MVCDQVAGLVVDGLRAQADKNHPVVRLANAQNVLLKGSQVMDGTDIFVEVSGAQSKGVALLANDLRSAKTAVKTLADAPRNAVSVKGNLK